VPQRSFQIRQQLDDGVAGGLSDCRKSCSGFRGRHGRIHHRTGESAQSSAASAGRASTAAGCPPAPIRCATSSAFANRLYPDEYPTHAPSDTPTALDTPDTKTQKTELERLVDEIRHTSPPVRDANLDALAAEKLFTEVGCAVCQVPTYKTLPPGTRINGGTYKVPKFLGNAVIHPYSDFLLHDVSTGDSVPQAAKSGYLDQSTANKSRTAPLWCLRFRMSLMHDGNSP